MAAAVLVVALFVVRHNVTRPAPVVRVQMTGNAKADSDAIDAAARTHCHKPHDVAATLLGIDAPSDITVNMVFANGRVRTTSVQCPD